MDPGIATFNVLFGVAAMAFGLWVHPRWRRAKLARQAREETLLFSRARARERLLWLQVVSSLGVGIILIAVVGVGALQGYLERRIEALERARSAALDRYVAECTNDHVLLENPGVQPRRIRLGKPVVFERSELVTEPEERWHASWLDPADVLLSPGQRVALRYQTTPGVWGGNLVFDLDLGSLRGEVKCKIHDSDSAAGR